MINRIDRIFFTGCGVRLVKTQDEAVKMDFRFSGKNILFILLSCLNVYAYLKRY
jgi:hypothetical protein